MDRFHSSSRSVTLPEPGEGFSFPWVVPFLPLAAWGGSLRAAGAGLRGAGRRGRAACRPSASCSTGGHWGLWGGRGSTSGAARSARVPTWASRQGLSKLSPASGPVGLARRLKMGRCCRAVVWQETVRFASGTWFLLAQKGRQLCQRSLRL